MIKKKVICVVLAVVMMVGFLPQVMVPAMEQAANAGAVQQVSVQSAIGQAMDLSNVVISAGWEHSLAIVPNGSIYAWGRNW